MPPLKWGSPKHKWKAGHAVYCDPSLELGDWLYRYMRAADAFRTIESGTMWFSSIYEWDDPHEKWWCDHLFRPGAHLATATAYGCCWTRRYLDEPFWRMYACDCQEDDEGGSKVRPPVRRLPAVRFRARAGELFSWLRDTASVESCKAYMGNVRYVAYEKLRHEAARLRARSDNPSPAAATGLLMKRLGFKFEHEVRMLWIDRGARQRGRAFRIDAGRLFDQVMIGPHLDIDRRLEVRKKLISLGVPEAQIDLSTIGEPPVLA